MSFPRRQYLGHKASKHQELPSGLSSFQDQGAFYIAPYYPQPPLLVPFWVPAYPAASSFPPHAQAPWLLHGRPQPDRTAQTEGNQTHGTGVFLPSAVENDVAPKVFNKGLKVKACTMLTDSEGDAESDMDSADSSSDCVMLSATPIKHGRMDSSIPIEQLLPEEWEY